MSVSCESLAFFRKEPCQNSCMDITSSTGILLRITLIVAAVLAGCLCRYAGLPVSVTVGIILAPIPLFLIELAINCCTSSEISKKRETHLPNEALSLPVKKVFPNELFRALEEGDVTDVKNALQRNDIDFRLIYENTPATIHALYCTDAEAKVKLLIESGKVDLNQTAANGFTLLDSILWFGVCMDRFDLKDEELQTLIILLLDKKVDLTKLLLSNLLLLASRQFKLESQAYLSAIQECIKMHTASSDGVKNLLQALFFSHGKEKLFVEYVLDVIKDSEHFHTEVVHSLRFQFNETLMKVVDFEKAADGAVASLLESKALTSKTDMCDQIISRIKNGDKLSSILSHIPKNDIEEIMSLRKAIEKRIRKSEEI